MFIVTEYAALIVIFFRITLIKGFRATNIMTLSHGPFKILKQIHAFKAIVFFILFLPLELDGFSSSMVSLQS